MNKMKQVLTLLLLISMVALGGCENYGGGSKDGGGGGGGGHSHSH